MPKFYLVDLESITCDEPRSQFAIEQIEDLAQSITMMGSLVQPIILEATSRQTYKLLAGALEYYAAVRASEMNSDIEMVDAFVIEPENIKYALKQLQILAPIAVTPPSVTPENGNNANLERRVNNIEARFAQSLQDLKADYEQQFRSLKEEFKALKGDLPQKSEPLEMFNTLSELELMQALRKAGIAHKTAQTITKNLITARTEQLFTSYSDVVSRTKELAEKRMLAILDTWLGF